MTHHEVLGTHYGNMVICCVKSGQALDKGFTHGERWSFVDEWLLKHLWFFLVARFFSERNMSVTSRKVDIEFNNGLTTIESLTCREAQHGELGIKYLFKSVFKCKGHHSVQTVTQWTNANTILFHIFFHALQCKALRKVFSTAESSGTCSRLHPPAHCSFLLKAILCLVNVWVPLEICLNANHRHWQTSNFLL